MEEVMEKDEVDVIEQKIMELPEVQAFLQAPEAVLAGKKKKLELYLENQAGYQKKLKLLGLLGNFRNFPYLNQMAAFFLLLSFLYVFFTYLPIFYYFLVQHYQWDIPLVTNLAMGALALNVLFIFVFLLIPWRACWPFFKSKNITKKPVYEDITKNRTLEYINPKKIYPDMWNLDDKRAVIPDPKAVLIGPNNIPIMHGDPEHGFGYNPRDLLEGHDYNIDQTVIEEYRELGKQEMFHAMRSGLENIKPLLPLLAFLFIIGLIMLPTIMQQMDQSAKINTLEEQNARYRMQIIDLGGTPYNIQTPTPQTQSRENTGPTPPSTGVEIK